MTWNVGVGGVWKEVKTPSVGVGGVWKAVSKAWIGVGGVWKDFYIALSASLTGTTVTHTAISPANATAGLKVDNDGYVYRLNGSTYTQLGQWLLAGLNSEFECRWTNTSGTLSSGTAGAWANCSTDQGWNVAYNTNAVGNKICAGLLEIRMAAAPNTVLASASYSLEAYVEL